MTHLTPRETQCLILVSQGLTDVQAAWQLGISPRTQRFHIANALDKLGASSRAHAVSLAIGQELIEPIRPVPAEEPDTIIRQAA